MKILEGVIDVKSVREVLEKVGSCTTFVDASYVVDREHVEFAVKKALKAWKEGRRVAKSLSMEILLYCAARRQISEAIEMGLKEGKNEVVAIVLEDECLDKLKEIGFEERPVLKLDDEKVEKIKRFFDISDEELKIVGKEKLSLLIREKIALFDVFKGT